MPVISVYTDDADGDGGSLEAKGMRREAFPAFVVGVEAAAGELGVFGEGRPSAVVFCSVSEAAARSVTSGERGAGATKRSVAPLTLLRARRVENDGCEWRPGLR